MELIYDKYNIENKSAVFFICMLKSYFVFCCLLLYVH